MVYGSFLYSDTPICGNSDDVDLGRRKNHVCWHSMASLSRACSSVLKSSLQRFEVNCRNKGL